MEFLCLEFSWTVYYNFWKGKGKDIYFQPQFAFRNLTNFVYCDENFFKVLSINKVELYSDG